MDGLIDLVGQRLHHLPRNCRKSVDRRMAMGDLEQFGGQDIAVIVSLGHITALAQHKQHAKDFRTCPLQLPGNLAVSQANRGGRQQFDDVEPLVEGGRPVAVRIGVNIVHLCHLG